MARTFTASLEQLHEMLRYICDNARQLELEQVALSRIEVAAEEVIVNIIQYGYPNQKGTIEIDCGFSPFQGFTLSIKDFGIPHNPLENITDYPLDAPIEDRPIGGCGILLICNLMDNVTYKRDDNANVLMLHKYLVDI